MGSRGRTLVLAVAALFVAAYLGLAWFGPAAWRYRNDVAAARSYIAAIEAFRQRAGRLPRDAAEARAVWKKAGLAPNALGCPCYAPTGDASYAFWVDAAYAYDSATRRWGARAP